jgi:two-component system NtrC family sensor kinase
MGETMDASEKKDWLLDERLLQSQKLAAIGELSAGIAHEINNPLAIIRQEAEWMQLLLKKLEGRDIEEITELNGSVHQIVQQVDRCTEITRNLLDFARKRDPVIQAVDVNRIIEDMTMLVEKEARHNNITKLCATMTGNCRTSAILRGDRGERLCGKNTAG